MRCMSQYMIRTVFSVLFTAFAMMMVGQEPELSVAERNAQMGFNDTIDRMAEDFVFVSLMVADPTDWRDDMLGTQGHAFLRLQCPVFDLDYCFSYESEHVNTQLSKYAQGKLKMGMFAYPTDAYLEDYRHWNRAVHEYRLNLPPDVETRLWEIMDNKLSRGLSMKLDLSRRGCAISVVHFIKAALQDIPIVYPQGTRYETLSRREILYQDMGANPWLRLVSCAMVPNAYDKDCSIDEKLIAPADLAEVWSQSTVNGKVFAEYSRRYCFINSHRVSTSFYYTATTRVGNIADNCIADYFWAKWMALGAIRYSVSNRCVLTISSIVYPAVCGRRLADDVFVQSAAAALVEMA